MDIVGNLPSQVSLLTWLIVSINRHATEIVDLRADKPAFHVFFVPGNPGLVQKTHGFLLFYLNCCRY